MRYISVCSGIEAASTAWGTLGWEPVAFSEIETFPSAVLKHHHPNVPNLGDMTKHKDWPKYENIDLIVGGTPCQAFSLAGLRKGLDDPRGNLTLVFLGVLQKYRPRWVVWENVPGVLSDKTGAFQAFITGLQEIGYGVAWRVLDAQYVRVDGHPRAVPQRRRRVFVVGHLGDWRRAAAVLLERESLSGNPPPRRQAGERVAARLTSGTTRSGGIGYDNQSIFSQNGDNLVRSTDVPEVCGNLDRESGGGKLTHQSVSSGHILPVAEPILATEYKGIGHNRETNLVAHSPTKRMDSSEDGAPCVAFDADNQTLNAETSQSLRSSRADIDRQGTLFSPKTLTVRRLTPRECERLQGFPDDYTAIPWRGKSAAECPDGPRYKAIGNSMAVNCMRWIGQRITFVENIPEWLG